MADVKVRDDKWRARNWLADAGVSDMTYVRDPEGDLTRDFAEVRAEGFAAGVAQERERCANFLAAKSAKIAEDAKTIPLGARSFRATLFASCPAWDVEQYVARIVAEDAAAIRAGEVRG